MLKNIKPSQRIIIILTLITFTSLLHAAIDKGAGAPYVDSKIIKARFSEITAEDMEVLRTKKILFASRSFGLNLRNGLASLAKQDKKYDILSSYARYDVFKAGSDLSVVPADAFDDNNFVHFLATYWPHSQRVLEAETLLGQPPHNFGEVADIVVIYFHTARPSGFDLYASKMDAMQKTYPNIKFIYVTSGFMGPKKAKDNEQSFLFSEKVRQRYKGKAPLYDLGMILSDDNRVGHQYCPEYSKDPADVHPSLQAGQEMMAKGFLLLLCDTLKYNKQVELEDKIDTGKTEKIEVLPASNPEHKAVRAILDFNDLKKKKVENVAVVENGHIVKLYLQEGGVHTLTDDIGTLTSLKLLHLYGDRDLGYPLLKKISPVIGKCTNIKELLVNQNDLTTLPEEITNLRKLKLLSVGDNHLKNLSPKIENWLRKYDTNGLKLQK